MEAGICHIVGAGEFVPRGLRRGAGDLLIAADGGYAALQRSAITPDLVLGDFDSLPAPPEHPNVITLQKEKDDTDMMAAIRVGAERGYRRFRLYGGSGGRVDHTLANVQCLVWLARRGMSGVLVGPVWAITAVTDGTLAFSERQRGYLSVFCMGDRAEGVYLQGLKYPLEDATLTCEFPLGVSNEFTGQGSSITVAHGTLAVVYDELEEGAEA